ncbi:hypothetical protein CEN41_13880 [Fischerella thermalis CCMEE 5330]|jgi:hypothetical protein|uniref:Uncharacterized protein n=1 Tax=Fischerella thermalis CCMEE 5330 TaxID=2019670 RepID=A0A2N6M8G3_9CYAN|nr:MULTISPECIES: hypothetical protein [Fischerella]PMB43006.1 hypothetical protein CEN41_13880 [Fischerella thermalis CCMEE 5330]PMB46267.1 hypothetical protein CEN39_26095 [Fischerella thermalis CCMEE 5201]BAU07417.1 hypothetical protein FIS3754_33450 [Fischerella sp. NIES-3754]BCX09745.1 MAG: hypothetical protein KatS3mg066_3604 [Fischerella sp.]
MRAQEVMGNVDENGTLCLDEPLTVQKHSRVKVIVLFVEDDMDEDDESKESVLNSLRTSLQEAKAGKTRPVSELWDGIDAE